MNRSKIVLSCLILFLAGVAAGPFVGKGYLLAGYALLFVVLIFIFYPRNPFKFFFLGATFFIFGLVRMLMAMPEIETGKMAYYRDLEERLTIEASVISESEYRNNAQYVVLGVRSIAYRGRSIPVAGSVLAKLYKYPRYFYGDYVRVTGNFLKPMDFEDFSYIDYLAKDDIHVVVYRPRVILLESKGIDGWSLLFSLKSSIQDRIDQLFTEPAAGLVAGILLGFRRGIPEQVMENFNIVGLTHILAISGYNITLIITVFALLLSKRGRVVRFIITLSAITLFAFLTGLSASVVRASIMGSFAIIAIFLGRRSGGINALFLSAVVMVLINPFILMSDISLQLSFTATLGLLVLLPLWENHLKKLPVLIRESLAVTIAAQVFTIPLILYYFGRFSVIAPFANVLFLPLIPLIMLISFIAIVASLVFYPFAHIWVAITWAITEILIRGVSLIALVPYASMEINFFNEAWLVCYYILMAILLFTFRKSKSVPGY